MKSGSEEDVEHSAVASRSPPKSIPRIEPVRGADVRPLWSVMIPTYEPDEGYLHETLASVLAQALPPALMQIQVVDDGSRTDVAAMVNKIGGGRVLFHRNGERQGLFGNWNVCIKAARGKYVHILHQDDVVLGGFYNAMGRGLDENSDAGAAFCRHIYIDVDGLWVLLSDIEQRKAGMFVGWRRRFAAGVSIQCPAMVVRRSAYEILGGFDTRFNYSGDAEMWLRIASQMPIIYEPATLACWRMHDKSASAALIAQGHGARDAFRIMDLLPQYFPDCPKEISIFKAKFLGGARDRISRLARSGHLGEALGQTRLLWSLHCRCWRTIKVVVRLLLIIAWASCGLRRIRVAGS